jgi:hypothetical protein
MSSFSSLNPRSLECENGIAAWMGGRQQQNISEPIYASCCTKYEVRIIRFYLELGADVDAVQQGVKGVPVSGPVFGGLDKPAPKKRGSYN